MNYECRGLEGITNTMVVVKRILSPEYDIHNS